MVSFFTAVYKRLSFSGLKFTFRQICYRLLILITICAFLKCSKDTNTQYKHPMLRPRTQNTTDAGYSLFCSLGLMLKWCIQSDGCVLHHNVLHTSPDVSFWNHTDCTGLSSLVSYGLRSPPIHELKHTSCPITRYDMTLLHTAVAE